jgi:hypothetical protein
MKNNYKNSRAYASLKRYPSGEGAGWRAKQRPPCMEAYRDQVNLNRIASSLVERVTEDMNSNPRRDRTWRDK